MVDEAARARLTAITACGDTRGRESGEEKWEGEQQQLRRRHRQLLSSSFLGSGGSEAEDGERPRRREAPLTLEIDAPLVLEQPARRRVVVAAVHYYVLRYE